VNSSPWQQWAVLVPIFEGALSWLEVFVLSLFHECILVFLLLDLDQTAFEVLHNFEEVFKTVGVYF
jgi:hypothetical protein